MAWAQVRARPLRASTSLPGWCRRRGRSSPLSEPSGCAVQDGGCRFRGPHWPGRRPDGAGTCRVAVGEDPPWRRPSSGTAKQGYDRAGRGEQRRYESGQHTRVVHAGVDADHGGADQTQPVETQRRLRPTASTASDPDNRDVRGGSPPRRSRALRGRRRAAGIARRDPGGRRPAERTGGSGASRTGGSERRQRQARLKGLWPTPAQRSSVGRRVSEQHQPARGAARTERPGRDRRAAREVFRAGTARTRSGANSAAAGITMPMMRTIPARVRHRPRLPP